ncbi:TPA: helix-turn-helix domain-containing protein [Salmonella enterica subsp. enterica serovar Cotham]
MEQLSRPKFWRLPAYSPKMTSSKIESAKKLLASGIPPRDVAKDLRVSVPTLYRWLPVSNIPDAGNYRGTVPDNTLTRTK